MTALTWCSEAGRTTDVGHPGEVSAPLEDEVAQGFAARVDDTVHTIDGHGVGTHSLLERLTQAIGQVGLGYGQVLEAHRRGRRRAHPDPEDALDEGRQIRLVVMGELDALESPAPPFHRGHSVLDHRRWGRRPVSGARPGAQRVIFE